MNAFRKFDTISVMDAEGYLGIVARCAMMLAFGLYLVVENGACGILFWIPSLAKHIILAVPLPGVKMKLQSYVAVCQNISMLNHRYTCPYLPYG
jgi:sulfite exporter TauE/SafE